MKPYLSIMETRFRLSLQYRAAAIAGAGTQVFWGLIRVMIFEAFFLHSTGPHPMELNDVITYVWLGQAFLAILPMGVDGEVRDGIRNGTIAYELLRPLDLYTHWFVRTVAWKVGPTLLRSIPIFVIAGAFLGLAAPASVTSACAFAVSLVGAIILASAITTLISTSLFWTISGEGAANIIPSFIYVFSGMVIPLPLLPDWAQPLLNASPFRGIVDIPYRLYLGHLPASELPWLLANQMAWTIAAILLGRHLLSRGKRRLVVQGG